MALVKTEAIVIKRMDLRETSLLVHFFTRDFGKIIGELKGIRSDPSKFASSVQLFSYNTIIFYQRASGIHLVSHCDLIDDFSFIRQELARITSASAVVELLNAIMPAEDKNEEVFNLALEVLKALSTGNKPQKLDTIFKIKLLTSSGFKPHLDSCVLCQSQVFDQPRFSLKLGGLLCVRCQPKEPSARSVFRGTVATILHIEKSNFQQALNIGMNPQIQRELNLILHSFLEFHLGKELKAQRTVKKLSNVEVP
ncbi:MAG: DNA repair protein RecO [Candidatus Omnitrophica bacterium]|nr:DNA repair protein RecO [Candidatus Omnitrophota bacterium]